MTIYNLMGGNFFESINEKLCPFFNSNVTTANSVRVFVNSGVFFIRSKRAMNYNFDLVCLGVQWKRSVICIAHQLNISIHHKLYLLCVTMTFQRMISSARCSVLVGPEFFPLVSTHALKWANKNIFFFILPHLTLLACLLLLFSYFVVVVVVVAFFALVYSYFVFSVVAVCYCVYLSLAHSLASARNVSVFCLCKLTQSFGT